MNDIRFEWNHDKDIFNKKKHGISFEEASSVFYDDYARIIPDPEHSDDEDRFIIVGLSIRLNLLVVCHCYRQDNEIIRIISARKAVKNERYKYSEGLK